MKKYFKKVDVLVFAVSLICLIWIVLYKFLFMSDIFKEPLFTNADILADITYTTFTSIVAAGIFYLFTIFIPKIAEIKGMFIYLNRHFQRIDQSSEIGISLMDNVVSGKKYTLGEYIKDDEERKRTAFKNTFSDPTLMDYFIKNMTYQKNRMNGLLINYSKHLPKSEVIFLTDFCIADFSGLDTPHIIGDESYFDKYFYMFQYLLSLNEGIRVFYNFNK